MRPVGVGLAPFGLRVLSSLPVFVLYLSVALLPGFVALSRLVWLLGSGAMSWLALSLLLV